MVAPDAFIPLLVTVGAPFAVGVGIGYFVHWLRVRREDAKEDRDQIFGPLLSDVTNNIRGMEGPWKLYYLPDFLSSLQSLAERGRLNPPRLRGLKEDWEALKESHGRMREAFLTMRKIANEAIDGCLEESLGIDIEGKSKAEVGAIPHENYHIDSRTELLDMLIAKQWGPLSRKYGRMSKTEEYDITAVVNWKDFWVEHQEEFEILVDDYLRSREEYLEDLKAVKRQLEKWTKNIYKRYRSALG